MIPILKITEWLNKEKELGSPNPDRVILSTVTKESIPHSRIVAVREINENGLLFFTQRGTRKVAELNENHMVSLVLWLPLQQRQVALEGTSQKLTANENLNYWETMPHDRQLRFSAYAPTSGQRIKSLDQLEEQYRFLSDRYNQATVPLSEFYCGFRVLPHTICFYTLGTNTFSEVQRFIKQNGDWYEELVSP
jgi:pyridoxamine 5'-phosphate oxidase